MTEYRCTICGALGAEPEPLEGAHKTNVEVLVEIMEYSRHGALMQGFIIDGLLKICKRTIDRIDQMPAGGCVSKQAWLGCAEELKAALEEHLR